MKHASGNTVSAETIFALSSGVGRSAVAVIRVSGPLASEVVTAMCGKLPAPRRATLLRLRSPLDGEVLDQSLVLWLPGPNSFTGEDCAEFHTHGGRAVVDGTLGALSTIQGCRPAEPGEFTRRAFLHGRMDLTAVEALADLIDAETRAQRRQALRHLDGPLGARADEWRATILQASALVEASIDFSDEGDVLETPLGDIKALVEPVAAGISALLAQEKGQGIRLRDGFTVVVAGPPNVGKSTLMNALVRRDVAIVSPIAGTTRDTIEAHLDLGGLPIVLVDTAGIRPSDDALEREGIERARRRASQADLVLWLELAGSTAATRSLPIGAPVISIATQVDRFPNASAALGISAQTGEGIDGLLDRIRNEAAGSLIGAETSLLTRARHTEALVKAEAALRRIVQAAADTQMELVAEDVRAAATQLGRISGRIDVEEILVEIFGRFCIGK